MDAVDITIRKKRLKSRKKFLKYFPNGFYDEKYIAWERGYKWEAHLQFKKMLNENEFSRLLDEKKFKEIAKLAVKLFSEGLHNYIHGNKPIRIRFERFSEKLSILPRKQIRVRTWPLQTVFGFISNPKEFIFLKPRVTQKAAEVYGYNFLYESEPNWNTYSSLLNFAKEIKKDISDLSPRDMIDIQSFIWILGSEEYD